ncbi:MAG TPA: hypothetical protein VL346_05725 [Acidobacteriaceae bacterium]|jgi:hypothetical protein|nr:hypothetical protein [Acidobacteriaceae bacterium]
MKLPNGEDAVVEISKLRDYVLSLIHPLGRHKARVFLSALDMSAADAEELRLALKVAAKSENAIAGAFDVYGARYIIDFVMHRANGREALVRSSWIVRRNEAFPRFVTCYLL